MYCDSLVVIMNTTMHQIPDLATVHNLNYIFVIACKDFSIMIRYKLLKLKKYIPQRFTKFCLMLLIVGFMNVKFTVQRSLHLVCVLDMYKSKVHNEVFALTIVKITSFKNKVRH